jgi:A/G-specific adenine glycosylase
MTRAAKLVVNNHKGLLPCNIDVLLRLPGIGNYSARAIACLAFGARVPMIDESSGRLLRRVLGLRQVGPAHSDYKLLEVAETILPKEQTCDFNLGLLDIASAYCHYNKPICPECPLVRLCSYGNDQKFKNIVKEKKC